MFGLFKKKKPKPVEDSPDHATLYIADPSLLGSKVLDTVPGILSYEGISEGESATGLRLRLKAGEVIMNFMPTHLIEEHLAGMSGYAQEEVRDKERLPYVLHCISQVRFVVGCVIPQGFDDKGTMIETLWHLNGALNGLFFLGGSLLTTMPSRLRAQPVTDEIVSHSDDPWVAEPAAAKLAIASRFHGESPWPGSLMQSVRRCSAP